MRSIVSIVGTIVSASVTIILNTLDVKEAITLAGHSVDWKWFILASFLVFCGFVGSWVYTERKKRIEAETQKAKLELSDIRLLPSPQSVFVRNTDGSGQTVDVKVWQVKVTNRQINSEAKNTRVKIQETDPYLNLFPVDLHKMHDDTFPCRTLHDLVYGEDMWFDVIGMDDKNSTLCIFRSDVSNHLNAYAFQIADVFYNSGEDVYQIFVEKNCINLNEGLMLRMAATASPPSEHTERRYRAYIDSQGQFKLELYGEIES